MILVTTVLAALSGSTTWAEAAPFLVAGVIGLIWPENTALQGAAQATEIDVAAMVAAFGDKGVSKAAAAKPATRPRPSDAPVG